MKTKRDKIAGEFYKRKFNQLSDEQQFDVLSGVKDNRRTKLRTRLF